ncbi:MAG: PrsW family intramembrane metalloprotease [Chloroflexi bacterium]|nr:PrsW family intramembrane metalloprotease [Chloroflexota bacterium]
MLILVATLAGIIPMVIYAWFLYLIDRHEREPLLLVVLVFLWGFVPAALLSLISQLVFSVPFLFIDGSGALAQTVGAVVLAPITEEIFKGVAVALIFLFVRSEFDSVLDGIVYGAMVGFGFAAVENILYFSTTDVDLGTLVLLRAVLFGLNHAFYTSLIGIGFGVAKFARTPLVRWGAPAAGLLGAMLVHAFHNGTLVLTGAVPVLFLLTIVGDYLGILIVFVTILVVLRKERTWIVTQLEEEIAAEVLSQQQYQIIASPTQRMLSRTAALFNGGPRRWIVTGRYYAALVDLAYKKHAHARVGGDPQQIAALRERAAAFGAELA